MSRLRQSPTPAGVTRVLQACLDERLAMLLPGEDRSRCGRRFTWCGDVLEFLVEGVAERVAPAGLTFEPPYPGPFRLWDEDQRADGEHVRRFWTVALHRGRPVARICTYFFHRHDRTALPRSPRVEGFPLDDETGDGRPGGEPEAFG